MNICFTLFLISAILCQSHGHTSIMSYFKKEGVIMNQHIKVGIIGEYDPNRPYHVATNDALNHAADALSISLKSSWISTQLLNNGSIETTLKPFDALLCASVDSKGMNEALQAIRFARERGWPFIGT